MLTEKEIGIVIVSGTVALGIIHKLVVVLGQAILL